MNKKFLEKIIGEKRELLSKYRKDLESRVDEDKLKDIQAKVDALLKDVEILENALKDSTNESEDDTEDKNKNEQKEVTNEEDRSKDIEEIRSNIARNLNKAGNTQKRNDEAEERAFYSYLLTGEIRGSVSTASGSGGVLIPKTIASQVITYAQEENILRRLGTVHQTGTTEGYPVLTKAATANIYKSESDNEAAESEITFNEVVLEPVEFDALATVTKKLLNRTDLNIEQIVLDELIKAYVSKEINFMFNGDDASNENAGALAKKAVDLTSAITATLTDGPSVYAALVKIKHSLKTSVRKHAKWILNDAAEALVEQLVDKNGQPLYKPDVLKEGVDGRLLGFDAYVTDGANVKSKESQPVFYFGDYTSFHIQDVLNTLEVIRLDQKYATQRKMGYMVYNILDAQLVYSPLEPTVYKWSPTVE